MVDMYQVAGAVAVALVVCVPIACALLYDRAVGRWDDQLERYRQARESSREHRRQIKALRTQQGIPIERIAADLRRLRGVLALDSGRSATQQNGTRLAYDRVLTQACAMLSIEHELDRATGGLERDIERLRVEAELEGAGVVLSLPGYGKAA